MTKMIAYGDIANNFKNNTLRDCFEDLTKKYGIFELDNLDTSQRHMVYKTMKHPLQFEKINKDGKTNIKIWNKELGKKNKIVKEIETQSNNSYSEESEKENDEESDEEIYC